MVITKEYNDIYELARELRNLPFGSELVVFDKTLFDLMNQACLKMGVAKFPILMRAWHLVAVDMQHDPRTGNYTLKKMTFIPTEQELSAAEIDPDHCLNYGRGSMDKPMDAAKILPTDYSSFGGDVERWADNDKSYLDCSSGCKFYLPLDGELGADWGVCINIEGPRCGLLTFEHQAGYRCFCDGE